MTLSEAQTALARLNADELEAISLLLAKLLAGKAEHGPLDINTDPRDWDAELLSEQLDAAFYAVFGWIKRSRTKRASVEAALSELRDAPALDLRVKAELTGVE